MYFVAQAPIKLLAGHDCIIHLASSMLGLKDALQL